MDEMWLPIVVIIALNLWIYFFYLSGFLAGTGKGDVTYEGKPCPKCGQRHLPIEILSKDFVRSDVVSSSTTRHVDTTPCYSCDGTGRSIEVYDVHQGHIERQCSACGGSGISDKRVSEEVNYKKEKIYAYHYQCSHCQSEWQHESSYPAYESRTHTVPHDKLYDYKMYGLILFLLFPGFFAIGLVFYDPIFFGAGFAGAIFTLMGYVGFGIAWLIAGSIAYFLFQALWGTWNFIRGR